MAIRFAVPHQLPLVNNPVKRISDASYKKKCCWQEVKILNLELQFGPESPLGNNNDSLMINQWTTKGWRLHTILMSTTKIGELKDPFLLVVLTRDVEVVDQ